MYMGIQVSIYRHYDLTTVYLPPYAIQWFISIGVWFGLVYITYIIRLTHVNVQESMEKTCRCVQSYIFYCKSHKNPYQYHKSRVLSLNRQRIKSLSPQYQAIPENISLIGFRWHCYSCCTLVIIQTATNPWYFPVQLCTMVIPI